MYGIYWWVCLLMWRFLKRKERIDMYTNGRLYSEYQKAYMISKVWLIAITIGYVVLKISDMRYILSMIGGL